MTARPDFEAAQHSLTLYYRALCGLGCEILPYDDDTDLYQRPDTLTTIRLPAGAPVSSDLSGGWYQVAITHRALHHHLGTFGFDPDRPEPLFARLRPASDGSAVPHLERFARLFGRTLLAVELFALLEDARIDRAADRLLPGLAKTFSRVRKAALDERPELTLLPPRSAVAEALVQFSLGATSITAPEALREPLRRVMSVASRLLDPRATVESTAEATIRVYHVLAGLPNVGVHRAVRPMPTADLVNADPGGACLGGAYSGGNRPGCADSGSAEAGFGHPGRADSSSVSPGEADSGPADSDACALSTVDLDSIDLAGLRDELRGEGDEKFDVRFVPVRYRDAAGPRYAGQQASGMPLQEAILRMTPSDDDGVESPDEDGFAAMSLAAERGGVDVTAPERPEAPPEPLPHDHGPDLDEHHHGIEGHVHPNGPDEFAYPEWDFRAGRYLTDWCLVRLTRPKPVRSDRSHRRALAEYGHLLPGLVAQLDRVRPAGRDLMLRMPYGDDLDLDACIDAMIDIRAGVQPSDRIYASNQERRRDVAVAFALDLSSSTAERLPVGGSTAKARRILDLQRDAVLLLTEALERIGDTYGIYGFSGAGRHDVRLSVVKDLDERRSPAMLHRMEGLTPDHTTRMAPAIRHLTKRLEHAEAATKILLIVSDGRPYDIDYGQQYGDEAILEYSIADTAAALDEARTRGVQPYLITVDPAGGDYLSRMCDPREYHVITEARELPASLAQLYAVARAR